MGNIDFSKWETWLHGLFAASLSAGGLTGTDWVASLIDSSPINWHHLGCILGVSSLGAFFLYLKQSPIPPFPDFKMKGPGTIQVPAGTTASVTSSASSPAKPIDTSSPVAPTITHP